MPNPIKVDLPEDIFSLMKKGICPICKVKMRTSYGKQTHSKNKSIVCEEQLRELLAKRGKPVKRSTMTLPDGREVEVDTKIISKEDANLMKKHHDGINKN